MSPGARRVPSASAAAFVLGVVSLGSHDYRDLVQAKDWLMEPRSVETSVRTLGLRVSALEGSFVPAVSTEN